MDKLRRKNLESKKWIGERLQEFVESKGKKLEDLNGLDLPGLTNTGQYKIGGARPTWPALISIAEACESDIQSIMAFIDPAPITEASELKIEAAHLDHVKSLLKILRSRKKERIAAIITALNDGVQAVGEQHHEEIRSPVQARK